MILKVIDEQLIISTRPYMQNFLIEITWYNFKKRKFIFEEKLSWKDIQGLSWTLEEPSFELNEKFSTYAQA